MVLDSLLKQVLTLSRLVSVVALFVSQEKLRVSVVVRLQLLLKLLRLEMNTTKKLVSIFQFVQMVVSYTIITLL